MVAPPKPVDITVSEAISIYLDACLAKVDIGKYSQHTYESYTAHLEFFESIVGEGKLLDDVTGEDCDRAMRSYAVSPDRRRQVPIDSDSSPAPVVRGRRGSVASKSGTSQKMFYSALAAFFVESKHRRWVQESPVEYMTLTPARVSNRATKREAMTIEQAQAVLDYGAGSYAKATSDAGRLRWHINNTVLHLLLMTGCRNSELTAADRADFVPTGAGGASWGIYGKGGKVRHVPVTAPMWDMLVSLWALLDSHVESGFFGDSVAPVVASAAFVTTRGNRLGRGYLSDLAHRARVNVAAVPEVSHLAREFVPHTLRHTAATQLVASGSDIKQVMELLGHSNLSTTSAYLDRMPGQLEQAVERAGFRFSSGT